MYTDKNFKTKKQLKEAVAAWNKYQQENNCLIGGVASSTPEKPTPSPVTYYQPGPFGGNVPRDGTFCIEGPHYPEPHRWYANVTAKDGVIIKVK